MLGGVHRLRWDEVPPHVRDDIARTLGAEVVGVEEVEGGFSPCLAAAVDLSDGRRVFVKSVSPAQNPESPFFLRRELTTAAELPPELPTPRLLAVLDDGEWVTGVFEHVRGRLPTNPWCPAELDAALGSLAALGERAAPPALPTARDRLGPLFDGWRQLRDHTPDLDRLAAGWWVDRLDDLVELECAALDVLGGDRLVHNDVRADNMLVIDDGSVVLVDWAHAASGPPWLDVVLWLPALQLEGGGTPEEVLARAPHVAGVDEAAITATVAGLTGYFVQRGMLPDPVGLPTLRAFQRAQGEIALDWLGRRMSVSPS